MKDDSSIWEDLGYWDEDLDGDVDFVDVNISDEMDESLQKSKRDYSDENFGGDVYDPMEEDDFDTAVDEDDFDELGGEYGDGISVTISLSEDKPERTFPRDGIWKYCDDYGDWDLKAALLDEFAELREDYDKDSPESVADIIVAAYEIEPPQALHYFKWLLDTFPLCEVSKTDEYSAYELGYEILWQLLCNNCPDPDADDKAECLKAATPLHDFILNTPEVFEVFFKLTPWEKHETIGLTEYMNFFIYFGDFEQAQKAYETYKEYHTNYTNMDLYKFWKNFLILYDSEACPQRFYDFVVREICWLEKYSNALLKEVKKYLTPLLKSGS